MANYATDSDISDIVPDIFEHGVASFTNELTKATETVNKRLKADWWNGHPSNFDDTKLNDAQWTEVTVYAALTYFILPRLSSFRPEDVFMGMSSFYRDRYEETYRRELATGVDYDSDGDNSYEDGEKTYTKMDRLTR
tara:strand:- start:139 stop:549 length:411 start_codon:yes stop_codon:yes gene_type:complete